MFRKLFEFSEICILLKRHLFMFSQFNSSYLFVSPFLNKKLKNFRIHNLSFYSKSHNFEQYLKTLKTYVSNNIKIVKMRVVCHTFPFEALHILTILFRMIYRARHCRFHFKFFVSVTVCIISGGCCLQRLP